MSAQTSPFRRDGKGLHGLLQLQPAPADVGQACCPAPRSRGVLRTGGAGLVHPLAVHKDLPAHDDGLGLLAALRQAPLRQQHVQPLFYCSCSSLLYRPGDARGVQPAQHAAAGPRVPCGSKRSCPGCSAPASAAPDAVLGQNGRRSAGPRSRRRRSPPPPAGVCPAQQSASSRTGVQRGNADSASAPRPGCPAVPAGPPPPGPGSPACRRSGA